MSMAVLGMGDKILSLMKEMENKHSGTGGVVRHTGE